MSTSRQRRRMQSVPNIVRVPAKKAKVAEVEETETTTYVKLSGLFGTAVLATFVWSLLALFGQMDWVDVTQPLLFFLLFWVTTTTHERND